MTHAEYLAAVFVELERVHPTPGRNHGISWKRTDDGNALFVLLLNVGDCVCPISFEPNVLFGDPSETVRHLVSHISAALKQGYPGLITYKT